MASSRENDRSKHLAGRPHASGRAAFEEGPEEVSARWQRWLVKAATIVLACFWIYSPVCHTVHHADWLWDDDQLLTANPTVQHRMATDPNSPRDDLGTLAKLWTNPDGADYFPLSYTALWAQWPFFQMDPRTGGPVQPGGPSVPWPPGYHLTSVVLHAIGSLLVWRLFAVMKIPFAWFGAMLFAVHPVCVESVAWVSELKNTLSMPLFLLSAISYVNFDDAAEDDDGRWVAYGASIVFFLLAMFAKTSVVAMPVVLLLYVWWKRGEVGVRDLVRSAPFFLISIVLGIVTIYFQHGRAIGQETINVPAYIGNGVATYRDGIIRIKVDDETNAKTVAVHGRDEKQIYGGPLDQETDFQAIPGEWRDRVRAVDRGRNLPSAKGILSRFAIAGTSLLFYLATIFWPVNLLPIYTRWDIDLLDLSKESEFGEMLFYLLPIPVILAAAWWFWRNRDTWGRSVIFGLGFFVLMVAPVLGFITISYMRITWAADHFIYLPMIGVIALISAALAGWFSRLPAGERPLLVAGCAAGLAVLTWISHGLATTWVNEDELWTHTLQHNENAWQAHNRLGAKKFARGHVDDIPIPNPTLLDPATQVKIKGSLHHFTRSTALRPDLGETHNNLGTALSAKGRLDEAIEQFKEAVRVTPHVPMIHVNLANALAAGGRFAEAEEHYLRLIQGAEAGHADAVERSGNANLPIDPSIAALINNYGVSLFKQGKKDEAIAAFKRALAINPNLKDARESLTLATGDKPPPAPAAGGPAAPPPGGVPPLPMAVPQSPTLGPTSP
ncbi:MAG: tetratricopeptide repeat protein [Planctomycetes bacterium]|nr:tetratricopeptide repeat protein [Planctomycetota bacterium]